MTMKKSVINRFAWTFVGALAGIFLTLAAVLTADSFAAITGSGPGGSFVTGDRWTASIAEKVRQDLNVLAAPKYWVGTADGNLANSVNLGALTTGLVLNTVTAGNATPSAYAGSTCATNTVATSLDASGALTCGITPSTASSTTTLTNKTLDAEGTGNAITLPFKQYVKACVTEGGSYNPYWDTAATNAPTATDEFGTNTNLCVESFPDPGPAYMWQHFALPSDWTGAVDVRFIWRTSATTGNVVWTVQGACVAAGGSIDPVLGNSSSVTSAAQATTNRVSIATLSGVTMTGCSAGNVWFYRIARDGTNASDTLAAAAELLGVEITYRRTM